MSVTAMSTQNSDEIMFFGEKEVRWYQIASLHEVEHHLINVGHKRICVSLPTGAGKTITSGIIFNSPAIRRWMGLSNEVDDNGIYIEKMRVMFLAHKNRLLSQAEETFAHANGVELICQSVFSDIPAHEIEKGWHLTVIDEAHHEGAASYQYKLELLTQNMKSKLGFIPLIGLTATWQRADGLLIKFDHIVQPISREQAVKEGWLSPADIFSFVDPTNSDNKTKILSDIFTDYHSQMGRGIVFVKTKDEVEIITQHIKSLGLRAVGVTNMSDKSLNTVLDQFSEGLWDFVVNCNKISEGVDVKGCDCVVIGRTVGSYPLLNQIIGRAARPDSVCRVFELINPFNARNLDTTVVVGTPQNHKLIYKRGGKWKEKTFEYVSAAVDDGFTNVSRIAGGIR